MYTFFSARFPNMCMPRTTFYLLLQACPPGFAFHGTGLACLPSWLVMVNVGWLCSMRSEIFLQMKFIIFQGCPTKQVAFLPGQPVQRIDSLFSNLCLFRKANIILRSFLSECTFQWLQLFSSSFGYLFELIFES